MTLYWKGNNYLGIGVSSHSFKLEKGKGLRFAEKSDYKCFLRREFYQEIYQIEYKDLVKEFFMLGLRMKKGVLLDEFKEKWGVNPVECFSGVLNKFSEFFVFENSSVRLTLEGLHLSNEIFEEILF